MKVKVILTETIKGVGKKDEIVEVKEITYYMLKKKVYLQLKKI